MKLKDLKPGDFFTKKDILYPSDTQVWIRGEYDRKEKKYWIQCYGDINREMLMRGDKEVYNNLIF